MRERLAFEALVADDINKHEQRNDEPFPGHLAQ